MENGQFRVCLREGKYVIGVDGQVFELNQACTVNVMTMVLKVVGLKPEYQYISVS